jgi:site-specific DNA-methyltransferase (adenine-specific)
MAGLPDKAFDLAIVDPPYGINVADTTTGTVIRNKSDKDNLIRKSWDQSTPTAEYWQELFRVSANQIVWGGNYFGDELGYCKAPILWDKQNGDSPYADGELAWTSAGLPRNLKIWRHQWCGAFKDSERGTTKIHPTQKPVALYRWLLKNYAKPGQRILDTHLGSGSIAIACELEGYDLVGCEIDADYIAGARKRLADHQAQPRLFDVPKDHGTQMTMDPAA